MKHNISSGDFLKEVLHRESMRIVVAGATGFVGKAVVEKLSKDHQIIALSRSAPKRPSENPHVEWRACDLFSLLDAEKAMDGADLAIYLVHSMRPSAALSQGGFEDFDLIVADNFVRAAVKTNLKQIIYLGGLLPEKDDEDLSLHLQSRKEVEEIFHKSPVPATILRAAMILGSEGSSFQIMIRLVDRLPVMICPAWTKTLSQPVALEDVVESIAYNVDRAESFNEIYDVAGPDVMSYEDMMKTVSKEREVRRKFYTVPFFSAHLSAFWVSLVTGAPKDLIEPLIQSLGCQMTARTTHLQKIPGHPPTPFVTALKKALKNYDPKKTPMAFQKAPISTEKEVRSVQRLPLPKNWTAADVARAYMKWLPRLTPWFLDVEVKGSWVYFLLKWPRIRLLVLEHAPDRSRPDRQLLYVRGGLLAEKHEKGRLEFRETLHGTAVLAALHNFRPKLPWYIYRSTQAVVHALTMRQFHRYLSRRLKRGSKPLPPFENPPEVAFR